MARDSNLSERFGDLLWLRQCVIHWSGVQCWREEREIVVIGPFLAYSQSHFLWPFRSDTQCPHDVNVIHGRLYGRLWGLIVWATIPPLISIAAINQFRVAHTSQRLLVSCSGQWFFASQIRLCVCVCVQFNEWILSLSLGELLFTYIWMDPLYWPLCSIYCLVALLSSLPHYVIASLPSSECVCVCVCVVIGGRYFIVASHNTVKLEGTCLTESVQIPVELTT